MLMMRQWNRLIAFSPVLPMMIFQKDSKILLNDDLDWKQKSHQDEDDSKMIILPNENIPTLNSRVNQSNCNSRSAHHVPYNIDTQ